MWHTTQYAPRSRAESPMYLTRIVGRWGGGDGGGWGEYDGESNVEEQKSGRVCQWCEQEGGMGPETYPRVLECAGSYRVRHTALHPCCLHAIRSHSILRVNDVLALDAAH